MRKVFFEDLPKWENGPNRGAINWKLSVGSSVRFVYDDIEGDLQVVDYEKQYITVKYKNNKPCKMKTGHFKNSHIGKIIGVSIISSVRSDGDF